jgi:aryl-alcohol dehydrogenase
LISLPAISICRGFPIDKMIKFYEFAEINRAAKESAAGIAIKPVLRMPQSL